MDVDLRPASILHQLIRLANEGKLSTPSTSSTSTSTSTSSKPTISNGGGGLISQRIQRDMTYGLDDPNDELTMESLSLMKEDEQLWWESSEPVTAASEEEDDQEEPNPSVVEEDDDGTTPATPLPLILFVRTDAATS
eukprot:scaffold191174_cov24-Attheya_sp.AAC.1